MYYGKTLAMLWLIWVAMNVAALAVVINTGGYF